MTGREGKKQTDRQSATTSSSSSYSSPVPYLPSLYVVLNFVLIPNFGQILLRLVRLVVLNADIHKWLQKYKSSGKKEATLVRAVTAN